jgi:citrate lyase subunit beta/citryl-CoA lyase
LAEERTIMTETRLQESPVACARVPLFVRADQPQRFAKAAASGADAVVLDLEDAVAADAKDAAREAIRSHAIENVPVIVRINPRLSEHHADDLSALRSARIEAVMIAKCEGLEDLDSLATALPGDLPIIPLIESARGLIHLSDILESARVCSVAFGAYDFSLDLGCRPDWEPLMVARGEIVWRSRAAGKAAPNCPAQQRWTARWWMPRSSSGHDASWRPKAAGR